MGAQELRQGPPPSGPARPSGYLDAMTIDQLIDWIAVRLRSEDVGGLRVSVKLCPVTDRDVHQLDDRETDERWGAAAVEPHVARGPGRHDADAAVTLRLP